LKAIEKHHEKPDEIAGTLGNIVRSADLIVKLAGVGNSGNEFIPTHRKLLFPLPRIDSMDIRNYVRDLPYAPFIGSRGRIGR
jgi:hypothetical protein